LFSSKITPLLKNADCLAQFGLGGFGAWPDCLIVFNIINRGFDE
jgi:hypothetical protein